MIYVQGAGNRKHILIPERNRSLCGAWFFGAAAMQAEGSTLPDHYKPKEGTPVCKHCLKLAAKAKVKT